MNRGRSPQSLHLRTGRKNLAGERIRDARLAKRPAWTMEHLAAQLEARTGLEMSISTIDRVEKGRRSVYDFELVAFATVLDCSLEFLLEPPPA